MAARDIATRYRVVTLALLVVVATAGRAGAFGEEGAVDVRILDYTGGNPTPRATAARRIAWEVRQRTSVETRLEPTRVRLDEPRLFDSPFLYWSGDRAFPPLSDAEIVGLKRFVDLGGFVLVDDAAPEDGGFDRSVRRDLARAFGEGALALLPLTHTLFRSFYLLRRAVGRVADPAQLEAVIHADRAAVVYSRHDLGAAWERDDLGQWRFPEVDADPRRREDAHRLGVNAVMYALCLDYKDDQVHAPFILRRQSGAP